MKYPLSYVAAEHQKKKRKNRYLVPHLPAMLYNYESRKQQRGASSGLNGGNSKNKTKGKNKDA